MGLAVDVEEHAEELYAEDDNLQMGSTSTPNSAATGIDLISTTRPR